MKIRISEDESYQIKLMEYGNQELSFEEFLNIVDKLNRVAKIFAPHNAKTPIPLGETRHHRKHRPDTPLYRTDRVEAVKLMKIHYLGKKEEKLAYASNLNRDWNEMMKGFSGIRKRFGITPQECGLTKFPEKGGKYGTH